MGVGCTEEMGCEEGKTEKESVLVSGEVSGWLAGWLARYGRMSSAWALLSSI